MSLNTANVIFLPSFLALMFDDVVTSLLPVPFARGYFPFDESVNDESGNGRDPSSAVETYAAGVFGQALAGGAATWNPQDLLTVDLLTGAYTIAFMVRQDAVGDPEFAFEILDVGANRRLRIVYYTATFQFMVNWYNPLGSLRHSKTVFVAPSGDWISFMLSVAAGTATLYSDGVAVGTQALTGSNPYAGDDQCFVAEQATNYRIDELAFWEEALSAELALQIATANVPLSDQFGA